MKQPYTRKRFVNLFYSQVAMDPAHTYHGTACWIWIGSGKTKRYGCVSYHGKIQQAHRVSYMLFFGDNSIKAGLGVLHHCDNPKCIRINHLFLGNQQVNMTDMVMKGRKRGLPGERNPNVKLTLTQVQKIRNVYASGLCTQKELAVKYKITQVGISHVVSGNSWK